MNQTGGNLHGRCIMENELIKIVKDLQELEFEMNRLSPSERKLMIEWFNAHLQAKNINDNTTYPFISFAFYLPFHFVRESLEYQQTVIRAYFRRENYGK